MSAGRVIVFLKAPRPGLVKTRLAAELDEAAAAAIDVVLIHRTLAALARCEDVELRFTPDDAQAEIEHWRRPVWILNSQGPGDLGQRLERAFAEAFAAGAARVLAVGTDCPGLTPEDIAGAFAALAGNEVVLGPAEDGGYWLIGLRQPAPELFQDIPWSTGEVFATTEARARAAGKSVAVLRRQLDVDTLEDWRRWQKIQPL